MQSLIVSAPAKINLFLGVGRLRPDGYHTVHTVLHTLALGDTVTLTPADALALTCDTPLDIPVDENLAYRAARSFSEAYHVDVLLDIALTKRIPAGAGLGGGSSDAAAILVGLAHWASLPLDHPLLLEIAASLGADVPFLLEGGAALMDGRGDRLVRRLPPLEANVVVVRPGTPVPTRRAYGAFDAAPLPAGDVRPVTDALRARSVDALAAALANNMVAASSSLVPEIAEALSWLAEREGVLGATMAGSGSAIFALCDSADAASAIADAAPDRGWWSAATETSASGPSVTEIEVGL